MRFISIYKFDPATHNGPPTDSDIAAMMALIDEMKRAGVFVDTGGVAPKGDSLRVRRAGNNVSVTDGPFTESKEIVGGYCVFDVASRDEAIEWSRRFLDLTGDGVTELHEIGAFD